MGRKISVDSATMMNKFEYHTAAPYTNKTIINHCFVHKSDEENMELYREVVAWCKENFEHYETSYGPSCVWYIARKVCQFFKPSTGEWENEYQKGFELSVITQSHLSFLLGATMKLDNESEQLEQASAPKSYHVEIRKR